MYGTVRTVVWEDGGSNPASYPIFKAKAEPAGLGPPADVLLPGSKSKQKCLLLAEGIFLCMVSLTSMGC